MEKNKKIRVAVLYGGRSGEHRISLQSAASVLMHLDPEKFVPVPVGIDEQGRWHVNSLSLIEKNTSVLPIFHDTPSVVLPPFPSGNDASQLIPFGSAVEQEKYSIDVVFPVVHGPLCEDGTLQGLFELAGIAYVGSGVLASAVAMDKEVAKRLVQQAGVPVVPWISFRKEHWENKRAEYVEKIRKEIGYPCFVKPANLGSSVGIHKVKREEDLVGAIEDALRYDRKVLVEKSIAARELEVAILEEKDPSLPARASVVGEIVPRHEYYSYQAKYIDKKGADLHIPAVLSAEQTGHVRLLAQQVFETLGCEGLARVDFFLDRDTGAVYFNELNSIPGFTSISMYPKLWEASGMSYASLLTHLIELALLRHQEKQNIVRQFHHTET